MRAAFYECDITPPLGGFVWGHYKPLYCVEVHTKIYAKALVVEDNGELAAIVAVDCCALPADMHELVTKRIYEYTGIPADKVCITSNHTHWGASFADSPEIECYGDQTYKDVAARLCADAVILASRRLEEVDVKFGTSLAPGLAFSRNFETTDGKYVCHGRLRTDVKRSLSEPDEELPVLIFERAGKPVGAIVNFACHQTSTNEAIKGYSGDYAAILSEKLKEKYGHDFVSLFLLGCCGDVNQVNPDKNIAVNGYKTIGSKLAEYYENSKATAVPLSEGGVSSTKEFITVARRSTDPEVIMELVKKYSKGDNVAGGLRKIRNMTHYALMPQPESTDLAVQCIRIGDVLIACLPGEVYTDLGKRLKKESPFKHTIVVENCNTYCGYIPTKEAFNPEHDELYETALCYHSCHVPEAGDILVDNALRIAKQMHEDK